MIDLEAFRPLLEEAPGYSDGPKGEAGLAAGRITALPGDHELTTFRCRLSVVCDVRGSGEYSASQPPVLSSRA